MKRINVRLVVALLLLFVVGVGGSFALYRFQLKRGAQSLLRLVDEKEQADDLAGATSYLKRYCARKHKDTKQLKRLALMLKKLFEKQLESGTRPDQKLATETYRYMESAVREMKDDVELRENAAELATRFFHLYPDAIEHLEYLIQNQKDHPKSDWKIQLAQVYELAGQQEKALPLLEEMIGWDPDQRAFDESKAIAPDDVNAYWALARLQRLRTRPEQADAIIEKMVSVNADKPGAHIKHGMYLMAVGEPDQDELEKDAHQALALAPDDKESILFAAQVALEGKDYVRAKALYGRCRDLFPKDPEPIFGLYTWAAKQEMLDKAIDYLNEALKLDTNKAGIITQRAVVEFLQGNRQNFEASFAEIEKMGGVQPMFVGLLRGLGAILREEWLDASKILSEIRPEFAAQRPEHLALIDRNLALAFDRTGENDKKLEVIQRLLTRDAASLPLRIKEIETLMALRQDDKAVAAYEELERVLASSPAESRQLALFRLQLELLKQRRLPEGQRDWRKAEELFPVAEKQPGAQDLVGANVLSEFHRIRGDADRAKAIMDQASQGQDGGLGERLAEIARQIDKEPMESILKQLDEVEQEAGPNLRVRLLRAFTILKAHPDNMDALLRELEEVPANFNEIQRDQLWAELGRYYGLNGRNDDARRLWNKVLEHQPNNVNLRMLLFQLALNSKDEAQVSAEQKRLEETFGTDSAEASWGRAAAIALRHREGKADPAALDNALSLLDAAISKRGNWSPLHEMRGDILLMKGRADLATAAYEQARTMGAETPELLQKLARLYYDQKLYDKARSSLDLLPREFWTKIEQRIHLHMLAMNKQLPDDLNIDDLGDQAEDFVWGARLLAEAGQADKAEQAFRKAVELDPKSPLAWSGLILLRFRANDLGQVEQLLKQAEEQVDPKAKSSLLATSYRVMGDFLNAEKYYLQSMQEHADSRELLQEVALFYLENNRPEKALPLLNRIVEGATPNDPKTPATVGWARRMLARETARSGNYDDYVRAIDIISQNRPANGKLGREDLLLWAQLAAARSESDSLEKAIEQLDDASRERELSPEESLMLAQLSESTGDWGRCQSIVTDLLINYPHDMQILDPWLRLLLKHDDLQTAAKWVKNCPENSLAAIRTNAHMAVRKGQSDQVIATLKKLLDLPGAPEEKLQRMTFVAQLAEELGAYDARLIAASDVLWKRIVQENAASLPSHLDFLLRRKEANRVPDIMELCRKAASAGQMQIAIPRAVNMLRQFRGQPEVNEKVESEIRDWLDKAEKSNPDDPTLLLQRSEFEGLAGNPDTQEQLLRDFLAKSTTKDVRRAIVLNNLAYMLALQGKGDEAQELVQGALKILGPRADLKDTIGLIHLSRNDPKAAATEFQYAIDHGQTKPEIYVHLAMALWASGQEQLATEALTQAKQAGLTESIFMGPELEKFRALIKAMRDKGISFEGLGSSAERAPTQRPQ